MPRHALLSCGASALKCGLKRRPRTCLVSIQSSIHLHETSCTKRLINTSPTLYQAKKRSQKDLFTPSPFSRSSKINVSDQFAIYRDLKEGPDNVYGIRQYLLLPRSEDEDRDMHDESYSPQHVIASLNA